MKRLHLGIDYFQSKFDNPISNPEDWHELLRAAITELKNEDIVTFMVLIDWYIAVNLSSGKKMGKSTLLVIQEYTKRVRNFEADLAKKQEEQNKLNAEAYKRIQQERIRLMNDPAYTGIAPLDKTEQALEDFDDDALQSRIEWHGQQSLDAAFRGDRENAAFHDREAARLTEIIRQYKKKMRYMEAYGLINPLPRKFDFSVKGSRTAKGIEDLIKERKKRT